MKLRPIPAALAIIALLVVAYFSLTLWLFHGWASDVPPYQRVEWHRAWSWGFLLTGLGSFGGAGVMVWQRRAGMKHWLNSLIGSEQGQ